MGPVHQRATTGIVPKRKKKAENKRHSLQTTIPSLSKKRSSSSYSGNVDEQDENSVFGTKKKEKRKSAVALKREEMARMKREMKTGKIENIPDEDKEKKEDENGDGDDDLYAFLDRSEDAKKHKAKM